MAIINFVARKPVEGGEIPREIGEALIRDMREMQVNEVVGFENPSRIAKTLGVSQPSARAWFKGTARPSYEVAKRFCDKTGKRYEGLFGETTDEDAMRWRTLVELVRDKVDPARALQLAQAARPERG